MSDTRSVDPLIMKSDRTLMDDGRYLIYYSFDKAPGTKAPSDSLDVEPVSADDVPSAE